MRMTFVGLLLCAAPFAPAALAQTHPVDTTLRDFMHARSFGTGGAFRALGLGADAIDGNPAAMTLFQRYQTELGGAWEFGGRMAFGSLAILDSTNPLAAGVSYHFAQIGKGTSASRTLHYQTLAFAMPLNPMFHFGASVHHLLMGATATTQAANAMTGDVGMVVRFGPTIHVGASAHNLIDTTHAEMARYFVLSGAFLGGMWSVAADVRADFGAVPAGGDPTVDPGAVPVLSWSVGGEYILGIFPLRAGYQRDPLTGAHYVSGGLGLMTQTGNIDLAYRQQLDGPAKLIALTIRLGN